MVSIVNVEYGMRHKNVPLTENWHWTVSGYWVMVICESSNIYHFRCDKFVIIQFRDGSVSVCTASSKLCSCTSRQKNFLRAKVGFAFIVTCSPIFRRPLTFTFLLSLKTNSKYSLASWGSITLASDQNLLHNPTAVTSEQLLRQPSKLRYSHLPELRTYVIITFNG